MSKRIKVVVTVLVAILLLTMGGATVVMANDESTSTSNTTSTNGLLARVAEILDISQEDLSNAFKQAQQEMRQEASIRSLDKAVEKGCITQQEAGEIKEWWEQKPEVLGSNLFPRASGFAAPRPGHIWKTRIHQAMHGRHMWGGYKGWCSDNTTQAG